MDELIKALEMVADEMELLDPVDRDSQPIEHLKAFDHALQRIHRVCHNFKDEASRPDVLQRWTLTPPW